MLWLYIPFSFFPFPFLFFYKHAVFCFHTCLTLNFSVTLAFSLEIALAHCAALDEWGILPVPPVPWLRFGALGTASAFKFLFCFNYWYLIGIISGTKTIRTSRKNLVLSPVICYVIFIPLSVKSVCLNAHWRDVNSFRCLFFSLMSSPLLFRGKFRKPDIWVSSISSPCPHFLT